MKLTQQFVFLPVFLLASQYASYSQCMIQGNLTDTLKAPIPFNPIGLLNYSDSAIVKGVISDADGNFCFEGVKKGSYRISVSAIGYKTFYSDQISYDSTAPVIISSIKLQSSGINLNEVSVAAQKKTIEFKNGNVIVNVEGTALAMGNTAYDLLSRLPGVTVSDGNISIQGKSGVKILIDGKLQQFSGQQLVNILKSMNASQIEKIEVLKKPPIKYDAAGTGGLINIKTNKLKLVGFSGNVFAGFSQGYYGNPSGGFTLNYKGRKVNFFSGFSATREFKRVTDDSKSHIRYGESETIIDQKLISKDHSASGTYNLGADWFINKNNSIGIKMNGAMGMANETRLATTTVNDNSLGYHAIQFDAEKPNPWIYPEFNLNAEHLFDTVGTTLRFSADYKYNWDIYGARFDNHYLDGENKDIIPPSVFTTSNTLVFNTSSALLDFEKELKKDLKLETGIKQSFQEMLSDYNLKVRDIASDEYVIDSRYSDVYDYKQYISAGYLNLSKQYKKFSFQMGARGENTIIHTNSKSTGTGFDRQYFNVFPLASIDFKKSDNHNFSLAYNKRVNRPDYNSFNPFSAFRSVFNSYKGNPYLKPEYSHDVGFSYSYKNFMTHSANFTRINNTFMGYSSQDDSSKTTISSVANLQWADVYAYNLFLQKDLFKWWTFSMSTTIFHIHAQGELNNLPYTISTVALSADMFTRIILAKGFSVEVNGFYLSPFLEGVFHTKARSTVGAAIKKTFFDEKLSVGLSFQDIFWGQIRTTTTDYQNQYSTGRQTFDTRRININLNYNFGKLKVQQRQVKDIDAVKSGK